MTRTLSHEWNSDHALVEVPTWSRKPTEAEWRRRYVWCLDRSASYLGAYAAFRVGRGRTLKLTPKQTQERLQGGLKDFGVGYVWVQLLGPDPMKARKLPPILDKPQGWVTNETLRLLKDCEANFGVFHSELWTDSHRPFDEAQQRLRDARKAVLDRTDPVGKAVLQMIKLTYSQGTTGLISPEVTERDPAWNRPDIYESLIARARANLQWSLWRAKGAPPVAYFAKDTCAWFSDHDSPEEVALEAGLPYGRQIGQWHEKGHATMKEVKAWLERPMPTFRAGRRLKPLHLPERHTLVAAIHSVAFDHD